MRWAEENVGDLEANRICSAFPKAGALLFRHIYPARTRLRMARHARAAAAISGPSRDECWHVGNLGVAHMELNQLNNAHECFQEGLKISRAIGDRWSESRFLGNLGLVECRKQDYRAALALFGQALGLSRTLGDMRHVAGVLNNLTAVYDRLGDVVLARESGLVALAIARRFGYPASEAAALNNLSLTAWSYGLCEEASEQAGTSLIIARRLHDRHAEAIALNSLGLVFLYSGDDIQRAKECFERALSINREMEDSEGIAYALLNLSIVAERAEDTERARGG